MDREKRSKKLIDILRDCAFEPRPYSGRGMMGRECVAISGDKEDGVTVWNVATLLGNEDIDVDEPSVDSLGLGIVIYWPTMPWPKDTENEL